MDIGAVKSDIQNNTIKPIYIFAGDEIGIQTIYINKIAESKNLEVRRVDSINDIYSQLSANSLFGTDYCYVIRDDKELLSNDKLVGSLIETDILKNNVLIICVSKLDKRTRLYKTYSDTFVLFETLKTSVLQRYLQSFIKLSSKYSEYLIEITGNSYSRMMLEADKIKTYAEIRNISADDAFVTMLKDGSIYIPAKDAIFDLVDAILRRQSKRVYNLLAQCREVGEADLVILNVLYTNAKQMLQVQSLPDEKDVCSSTGLTSWQVKCAKARIGAYRHRELVKMLRNIKQLDGDIKKGIIADNRAVDYLLVRTL